MRAEAARPPRQVPSRQPRPRRLVRDGARPPAPGRERLVAGDAAGPGAAGRRRSATGRSHAPGRRPGAGGEPVVKPPRSSETLPVESGEVVSDQTFRVTLANLPETSAPPTVSAYDPLRDTTTPAQLVSRAGNTAVFELAVTDYPRLLTLDYPVS
jgi:hypothetical protein